MFLCMKLPDDNFDIRTSIIIVQNYYQTGQFNVLGKKCIVSISVNYF